MTDFDTADFDIFLSDFATTVTCSTWGTSVQAIFDETPVYFEENTSKQPALVVETSDIPATVAENDQFVFIHPVSKQEVTYRLVTTEPLDAGMSRILLKL